MTDKIKNIAVISLLAAFIAGFSVTGVVSPDKEISLSERRKLAQMPEISTKTVSDSSFMADFEKYSLDQFPLREQFRTLKSIVSFYGLQKSDNNNIYISGGYASKLDYPLREDSVEYAVSRVSYIYDKYIKDSGCDVYYSVIPDKNYFLAEQGGYPSMDYDRIYSLMHEKMTFAKEIEIASLLEIGDYYKTDTHWSQDKIGDVAERLATEMGVGFDDSYIISKLDTPFYGVYYGQCALPMKADELWYVRSNAIENSIVYDYETSREISVYDMEKLSGADPYEMYLAGSKSLLTILNENALSDKKLIIFRDSFGSSITPYLIGSYRKITLIDTRYIHPNMLKSLVNFEDCDVLFMYSTLVLNSSNTFK